MITIKDVFKDYKQLNNIYDSMETEAITLLVISEISKLSKASVKAFPERELSAEQSEELKTILTRLQTGEPIQYILGETEFYGLPFKVNPSVLIPRSETEELVEWILETCGGHFAENSNQFDGAILDIGTGSGCIAISLKKNLPNADISAVDISETALQTARVNTALNKVEINFMNSDILDWQAQITKFKMYNLIVSNPPYVTLHDKQQMHINVTDHEPHSALFVPEDDPLLFYHTIADFALAQLPANGLLFFEINENYGSQTVEMLRKKGFVDIILKQDMSGRDRMIKAAAM
ncbi:peptide chain release factor N(5)-glutamine methyltransferase [Mucilaginibacter sp. RCC_168]|uniref:peptide chain release factor N(5)-glutamine methyltransferase n=1 Tax=Mucilaginibacter sp. RCC_168 TaxID=3239221 RepID=UPI0035258BF2